MTNSEDISQAQYELWTEVETFRLPTLARTEDVVIFVVVVLVYLLAVVLLGIFYTVWYRKMLKTRMDRGEDIDWDLFGLKHDQSNISSSISAV